MPLYKASARYSASIDGTLVTFAAGDVIELDGATAGRITRDVGRRILERVPAGTLPDPRPEPAVPATKPRPPKEPRRTYTVQHAYRAGTGREGENQTGPDWKPGDRVELTDSQAAYRARDSPGLLDPEPVQPEPVEPTAEQLAQMMPAGLGNANPMGVYSLSGF